jgi:tRNA modification GTPase
MTFTLNDTIAAVASAPGSAVRGIIRVSGQQTANILANLLSQLPLASSAHARGCDVEIPLAQGSLRMPALLMFWPTSRSFTGEPVAEFHLPGSPPLLNEVLEELCLRGARPAERGEFTLRAFLAGRIDLVQAEAVLGVIEAGSQSELQSALEQLAGGISQRIGNVREQLLLHLADLEAGLDFVDEDIEFVSRPELQLRLEQDATLLRQLLDQASGRMVSTGRPRVVLAGLPNAGKSTLFNALVGRPAALVSESAGTTRDYLVANLCEGASTWDLIDTAGWEQARDGIEALAGELRSQQYQRAQLILWCTAADLSHSERRQDAQLHRQCQATHEQVLHVITKADRVCESPQRLCESQPVLVSGTQHQGVSELRQAIRERLSTDAPVSEIISSTAARCAESLRNALAGMERARSLVLNDAGDELIAMELREVLDHLGRVVGRVYTDDILDRIFSRFCIGK